MRLILTDIDRTVLPFGEQVVPEHARAALRAAVEQIREKRRREQEEQDDTGDEDDADNRVEHGAEAEPSSGSDSSAPDEPSPLA